MTIMAIISWTYYKQKILVVQIVAILLGMAGVLMVFQREIFSTADVNGMDLDCLNVTNRTVENCVDSRRVFGMSFLAFGLVLAVGSSVSGVGKFILNYRANTQFLIPSTHRDL